MPPAPPRAVVLMPALAVVVAALQLTTTNTRTMKGSMLGSMVLRSMMPRTHTPRGERTAGGAVSGVALLAEQRGHGLRWRRHVKYAHFA